ncbi:MAG: hypothetical protein IKP53_08670 [Candidatus Methanomethylophilaceae archaeon]|nr:hypothetical protein [Candidatus Methanomethylophilaceae archaeon]
MMKVVCTHFVLKGKSNYKSLAPVFPDLLKVLLEGIGQMPEEEEILQMYIELNMADLSQNRKPEGYNRKGKVRLVFPIERKEFYLKSYEKVGDIKSIVSQYRTILDGAKIKYEIHDEDNYMDLN